MTRSQINRYLAQSHTFFSENQFVLPPFAEWTPQEWQKRDRETNEIRKSRLGWDVTDFDSGRFSEVGLTLFTLRNGSPEEPDVSKCYAEKIMFVRQNQVTPFHYHVHKTEDIINRGGKGLGRLSVQLYNAAENGEFALTPVNVKCDGVRHQLNPGDMVTLGAGESITLTPYLYHKFWAIEGNALIGEVSSVNDDATDNFFKEPLNRFPTVLEDQAAIRLLCSDY